MQRLIFYIFYPLIWLVSKSPFVILYAISDFVFLIVYYVIGYRKKLVYNNLKRSFPDKSHSEIQEISRKFFHHFVDIIFEVVKTFTISKEQISKRYAFKNMALIESIAAKNKSLVIVGSHYGNWEWMIGLNLHTRVQAYATYTMISNKIFEEKIKTSREKFGVQMILKKDTISNMANNYRNKKIGIYGLLSDQSPQLQKTYYWSDFLGVRVPIHTGAEMLAKKYDCVVVNYKVDKVKRGYYEVEFELLTENPRNFADYEITDIYLDIVEKQIREKPIYYLWTHNRFKHEGKEDKNKR